MSVQLAKLMRPSTLTEARESFADLVAFDCHVETPGLSRAGLTALDHFFFAHRLRAKTKHHLSFAGAMKDPQRVKHLTDLVRRYKKRDPTTLSPQDLLRMQYSVFQLYYGTINQFRPAAAKWAYCTLGAKHGILDFSSGWGGRAIAAASLGIPYYGFDANRALEPAYRHMFEMVKSVMPDTTMRMRFQPSETADFSRLRYDLIFTSPPYFMLEEYEGMPTYSGRQGFLDHFFVPVVGAAWRHLMRGGHMALNMPVEMFEAVRGVLPPVSMTLELPISNRHPTNAVKKQALGSQDAAARHELIYVWRKHL